MQILAFEHQARFVPAIRDKQSVSPSDISHRVRRFYPTHTPQMLARQGEHLDRMVSFCRHIQTGML